MFGRRSQRDFEDEIRSHLQMEIERLEAQGMSRADAERAARRNFGNIGVAEDNFYHAQRFAWVENAATAGMFGVVNTVMLEPLPFPKPDRLVFVQGTAPGSDLPERFDLGND